MVSLLENVNFWGAFGSIAKYVLYFLWAMIVIGVGLFFMYVSAFKIKAEVVPLHGSSKNGALSFGRKKKNRFKWVENKTKWKPMYPLFTKTTIEPFDPDYIYQGNKVIAFKLGEDYIPGKYSFDEKNKHFNLSPVPYYIRNWQSLEYRKNQAEFSQNSFWEQNKYFIMVIIAAAICCAMVLGTAYLSYQFTQQGVAASSSLAESIRNFQVIPGK